MGATTLYQSEPGSNIMNVFDIPQTPELKPHHCMQDICWGGGLASSAKIQSTYSTAPANLVDGNGWGSLNVQARICKSIFGVDGTNTSLSTHTKVSLTPIPTPKERE